MKELSIKEKAKRYDEALEKAKEFKNNPFAGYDCTDLISALFPELKDSKDDTILLDNNEDRLIAETIKEKPAEKVKLKFNVGDTIQTKQGKIKFVIGRIDNGYYWRKGNNAPMLRISDQDYWELVERNSAWSEEDRDYYDAIITKLEVTQDDALLTDNQMEFLKSLRHQNTWKPSDKQMEVLWKYAEQNNYDGFILTSLYEQLKKLRKE